MDLRGSSLLGYRLTYRETIFYTKRQTCLVYGRSRNRRKQHTSLIHARRATFCVVPRRQHLHLRSCLGELRSCIVKRYPTGAIFLIRHLVVATTALILDFNDSPSCKGSGSGARYSRFSPSAPSRFVTHGAFQRDVCSTDGKSDLLQEAHQVVESPFCSIPIIIPVMKLTIRGVSARSDPPPLLPQPLLSRLQQQQQ